MTFGYLEIASGDPTWIFGDPNPKMEAPEHPKSINYLSKSLINILIN